MSHQDTINLILLLSVVAPIVVFAAIAFYRLPMRSASDDKLADFLYAEGKAEAADFSQSTVAYMLQIYVTFYFIFWGYHYGLSNIFYLLSWGLGIWCFVKAGPRILVAVAEHETLPNILSHGHRQIRVIFGIMSGLYFAGMLYLESHFAAEFLSAAVVTDIEEGTWWLFFAVLLTFVVAYSSWGGIRKVFLTDRYQLSFAYFGFAVVIAHQLLHAYSVNATDALVLSTLMLLIYGFLTFKFVGTRSRSLVPQIILLLSFLVLFATTAIGLARSTVFGSFTLGDPLVQIREPGGAITLAGFVALNLLWQFCDASNFQRVLAIRSHYDRGEAIALIQQYFRPIIWASPITWGLGIVLGMSIRAGGIVVPEGITEYGAFIDALVGEITSSGNLFAMVALGAMGTAVASVMLSTADSSVAAFYQAATRDILGIRQWRSSLMACIAGILVLLVVSLALLVRRFDASYVFTVVASVNSQVLIAAPAILMVLVLRRFDKASIVASLLLGTGGVWWATFSPPDSLLSEDVFHQNVLLVYPIGVGLTAAVLGILPSFRVPKMPQAADQ